MRKYLEGSYMKNEADSLLKSVAIGQEVVVLN